MIVVSFKWLGFVHFDIFIPAKWMDPYPWVSPETSQKWHWLLLQFQVHMILQLQVEEIL